MTDTPSGEVRKAEYKRTKMISLIAGLLTAATPGIYGAWQAAKAELKTRQEEVVRDKQEGDIQKNVRALQVAVAALQKSAVTQRDLVDLVLRLRADRPTPRRRPQPAEAARAERLERELTELKKRAESAAQAAKKAVAAKRAAPAMQPAKNVRKLVQQANGF